jgi:hypothetical protein
VNRFAGRRKSVFAEQYDPEEDEEEENNKVIFPKTDEQRNRLCDSVKNILLFRSLDPEQVNNFISLSLASVRNIIELRNHFPLFLRFSPSTIILGSFMAAPTDDETSTDE